MISGGSGDSASGVYVHNGIFNMYGGKITGNTATAGSLGGGVYVAAGAAFDMYGGEVSGNVDAAGGSSDVVLSGTAATITVSGDAKIGNLALIDGQTLTIGAEGLSENASINIVAESGATINAEDQSGGKISESALTLNGANAVIVNGVLHTHQYAYSADAGSNVIKETCSCGHSATLTVSAPEDLTVNGSNVAKEAPITYSDGWVGSKNAVETYYSKVTSDGVAAATADDNWTKMGSAPVTAGTYLAEVTYEVVTASVEYTLTVAAADPPATTYTVTYEAGDTGVTVPDNVEVTEGSQYFISNMVPVREGYIFQNWKGSDGQAYKPGDPITVNGAFTLTAQWKKDEVTVTYGSFDETILTVTGNTRGAVTRGTTQTFTVKVAEGYDASTLVVKAGTVALSPVQAESGTYQYSFAATEDTTVTFVTPSKLSYTVMMPAGNFTAQITGVTGGTKADDGGSAVVEYGGSYTFTVKADDGYSISRVVVNGAERSLGAPADGVYTITIAGVKGAQSVQIVADALPTYTVTFTLPLTGNAYTTQTVTQGKTVSEPEPPSVPGYTFIGWFKDSDSYKAATTEHAAGAYDFEAPVDSGFTLYGKLVPETYTVAYDLNGGTGTFGTQTKTYGVALQLREAVPEREGYTFLGWGTAANAEVATYQPGGMYTADSAITLYAVWQEKTYTVSLSAGTGYSVNTDQSTTVPYGASFIFTVTVDAGYAVKQPTVRVNGVATDLRLTGTADGEGGTKIYTYQLSNIKEDKTVSISVTRNDTYRVTFTVADAAWKYQDVEYGYLVSQPEDPSVKGYTFEGWYTDNTTQDDTTRYDFSTSVTRELSLYAKLTAITPAVSWPAATDLTGCTIQNVNRITPGGEETAMTTPGRVAYDSTVTFNVVVSDGYDASCMSVAVNGQTAALVKVAGSTYSYAIYNVTKDQNITVTGVVRKTISITYNDNGGYGGPVHQTLNAYVAGTRDNGTISTTAPSRGGYTFLGWSGSNTGSKVDFTAGADSTLTEDTVLYAVWKAVGAAVTLKADKYAQYEGQSVTLTAAVTANDKVVTSGSVEFFQGETSLGVAKVSGGQATMTATTSAYGGADSEDTYTATFIPDTDAGYAEGKSEAIEVTIYSAAIAWANGAALTVYEGKNAADGTPVTTLIAGQTYTLVLPAVAENGKAAALTLGADYEVSWFQVSADGTKTSIGDPFSNSVTVIPETAGVTYYAVAAPKSGSDYTKAVAYDADGIALSTYAVALTAAQTDPSVKAPTELTLTLTGVLANDIQKDTGVKLTADDTTPAYKQYEGMTITLTAEVTPSAEGTTLHSVSSGAVTFYAVTSALVSRIGSAAVDANGTACVPYTLPGYSREDALCNIEYFFAVYSDTADTFADSATTVDVASDPFDPDAVTAANVVAENAVQILSATDQRPVTLSATQTLLVYGPDVLTDGALKDDAETALRHLLLNYLAVGKYNGEGGLNELLNHTISDLDIQIASAAYDPDGSTIEVKVELGNSSYYLVEGETFTFHVAASKIRAVYGTLGWTSAAVVMYGVDENGDRTAPVDLADGTTVTYYIYERDAKDTADEKWTYLDYKNKGTIVREVEMTKDSGTGVYQASYSHLAAGSYVMFAIADGYTIVE